MGTFARFALRKREETYLYSPQNSVTNPFDSFKNVLYRKSSNVFLMFLQLKEI